MKRLTSQTQNPSKAVLFDLLLALSEFFASVARSSYEMYASLRYSARKLTEHSTVSLFMPKTMYYGLGTIRLGVQA